MSSVNYKTAFTGLKNCNSLHKMVSNKLSEQHWQLSYIMNVVVTTNKLNKIRKLTAQTWKFVAF